MQPTGIYAAINRLFALDSKRSTGIPLNPQFRNPPPGGLDPATYDDPVTLPAADIAENPYWKRDVRRRYPRLSTVTQADAVALLEVGSAAAPKHELIGEAGSKQLVAAQEEGAKGLAVAFERNTGLAKDVLSAGGMPPLPSGLHVNETGSKRYELEKEQSYGSEYVKLISTACRLHKLTFLQLPLQDVRISCCGLAHWTLWKTIEVPVNTTAAFSLSDVMSKPFPLASVLCSRVPVLVYSVTINRPRLSLPAVQISPRGLDVYSSLRLHVLHLGRCAGLASCMATSVLAHSHLHCSSRIFYPTNVV